MTTGLEPDPSMIGGVPKPPFVMLPDPVRVFQTRGRRFAFLAETSRLAPYLQFLADLSSLQARLVVGLPAVAALPAERLRLAREARMPPIDRAALTHDPALVETLARLCAGARALAMPEPARLALTAVAAAGGDDRAWLLGNVLADTIPGDSAAPHLFAAAAAQVHLARLAATLPAEDLVSVRTGLCPCCGGLPVASSVTGAPGIENVRYATCASCATQWNEIRIKCLGCGSTKGISYRSAETTDATVKAEVCGECASWLKIFYQVKNPTLDPVADDVGSLGLDLMMQETGLTRGGFHPFLAGY